MIAADLETTGLDAANDQIVAIGWVQLDRGRIVMGSSRHVLIRPEQSVGASATIHELLDREVAGGESLGTGLEMLFEAARDRIWIFHHAGLDVAFLREACAQWSSVVPPFLVLDTMRIEFQRRRRRETPVKQGDLQLGHLRQVYGLPRYTAHNALIDAVATAELLLAMAAQLEPGGELSLGPHLKRF
jgi:DNA polymerase-3 subunit epsilon